jgi:hypothetical protein
MRGQSRPKDGAFPHAYDPRIYQKKSHAKSDGLPGQARQ